MKGLVVSDNLEVGGHGEEIKYEVRSTKYEVRELGATELRKSVGRRQSRNDASEPNPCTRGDDTSVVCEAMKRCSRGTGIHHA